MKVSKSAATKNQSSGDTGTVVRVLQLLECLGEQQEWRVGLLAQRLKLPRSTTHRLLNLCLGQGFAESDGAGVYRPGLGLYRIAGRLAFQMPVRRIAAPLLTEFTHNFSETSLLTLLDRRALKAFFAAKAEASAPMRYVIETNALAPLGWGASGRAILAFMSEIDVAEVARRAEPSPVDGRPLHAKELLKSLPKIRTKGYAMTQNQRTPEGVGIAVPFFDAGGEVAGNVCVTVPVFRFKPRDEASFARALADMATKITDALGSNRIHEITS
jgi:IclR family transcriptional regulator, KDG regulon repressor